MARLVLKKSWADLRSRKLQSLLVCVIVGAAAALGVLAISITQAAGSTYETVLNEAHGGHVWLFSGASAPVSNLASTAGVASASGPFALADATLTSTAETYPLHLWAMGSAMPTVAPTLIREGHWLDGGADEVVIDRGLAKASGLKLGSKLSVAGAANTRSLTVVGIGINTTSAPYPLDSPADVFTTANVVGSVSGGRVPTYAGGVRLTDPSTTDAFVAASRAAGGQTIEATTWQDIRDNVSSGDQAVVILLRTFAVFAFFAVGFVLANTVSGQVLSQYRDIGLLRAMGLTPGQVTTLLLIEQLALASVAAVVGALIGVLATPLLLGRIAGLLDTTPDNPFNPATITTVIAVVLAEVLLFTIIPAWRGGRLSTVQALTVGPSRATDRPSKLAALAERMHLPGTMMLGVKDLFSRPGRTWLSIAALVLAFSTIASALTIEATVRAISDDPLRIGRPPYQLELTSAQTGATGISNNSVNAEALAQPGVASTLTLQRLDGSVVPGDVFPTDALSGDLSKMPYPIKSGRMFSAPGEAVVGLNVAREDGVRLGDVVTLSLVAGPQLHLKVVGLVASEDNNGKTVLYSMSDLASAAPQLAAQPATVAVRLQPGADVAEAALAIRQRTSGTVSVANREEKFRSDLASRAHDLRSVTVPLTLSLIAIALINLVSTLAFAIRERVAEFGVLKTIGFTPWQISGSVAFGSALLAVIAAMIGAPLGYFSTSALVNHFGEQGGWPAGVAAAPPVLWAAIAIPLAILAVVFVSGIPGRTAARLRIAEALRFE
ncbi:MAG: FtsX-like permease family protein [Tepidiformaceae bacterium]